MPTCHTLVPEGPQEVAHTFPGLETSLFYKYFFDPKAKGKPVTGQEGSVIY